MILTARDELHGLFKILKYIFKLAEKDWTVIVSSDRSIACNMSEIDQEIKSRRPIEQRRCYKLHYDYDESFSKMSISFLRTRPRGDHRVR